MVSLMLLIREVGGWEDLAETCSYTQTARPTTHDNHIVNMNSVLLRGRLFAWWYQDGWYGKDGLVR